MIRSPAVAGRFYPSEPAGLAQRVREFTAGTITRIGARACMVPHAGYLYSGAVAGAVYGALRLPSRFILIGPRHFPGGQAQAILSQGAWRTPLGEAQIDQGLAEELKRACPVLREDHVAHAREHALEVQLPFLQQMLTHFTFVPIALGPVKFEALAQLGTALASVVAAQREPVLLVASSDLNHYENDAVTRLKDQKAIEQILALNPRGLYDTVRSEGITMCGYGAAVAMMTATRELGARAARLVRYATSAEASGDYEQVVGYAGIIVE